MDKKTDTLLEHVLYRVEGDKRVPLLSDPERGVVEYHRLDELRRANVEGRPRPQLVMTRRECTYPLNEAGERQALGSTCEETDL